VNEPDLTLGWDVLAWCSTYIRQPDGPDAGAEWRFTREQVLFVLWWYAVNDRGRFLHIRGVLRRAKGWGKSPFVAALALAELCGPTRCDGFDARGKPVAVPVPMAWVQLAGVSEKQTVNTMSMVLAMIAESPVVDDYGVDPGLTRIFTRDGGRLEPITASAPTAEGARPTFVVEDETHLWLETNGGHKLDQVNRRNLGKSRDGAARLLETTNAHEPGQDSVAERSFEAWQAKHRTLLYDALEAPDLPDLTDDAALIDALRIAYGDSTWVDLERVRDEIHDPSTPADVARRFYLNQVVAGEVGTGAMPADAWRACAAEHSKIDGRVFLAAAMTPDRSTVSLAAAGRRSDGLLHVEIVFHGPAGGLYGPEQYNFIPAAAGVAGRQGAAVAMVKSHPIGSLAPDLEKQGARIQELSPGDYTRGCGAFFDDVTAQRLRYIAPQPELDAAIGRASRKASGDAWRWAGDDISALVAATQAAQAARMAPVGGSGRVIALD
jgi:hypothetical protein